MRRKAEDKENDGYEGDETVKRLAACVRNRIKNLSVFLKITLLFGALLILAVISVAGFAAHDFSKVMRAKEVALGNTNMDYVRRYMEEKYERICRFSSSIHESSISEIMAEVEADPDKAFDYGVINQISEFSRGVCAADSDISDVILVSVNGQSYTYTPKPYINVNSSYAFMESKRVRQFLETGDYMYIFRNNPTEYCLGERGSVISFMGRIYDSSLLPQKKVTGIYIINIPVAVMEAEGVPDSTQMNGKIIMKNSRGEVLFEITRDRGSKDKSPQAYFAEEKLSDSGLTVQYSLSDTQLMYEIRQAYYKVFWIMVSAVVVTLLIYHRVYRVFRDRIRLILEVMNKVEQGDLDSRIPVVSGDEFGIISNSFNTMCSRLDEYIKRVYEAEIQRKNAEVDALQMQINPHFLYNTLESIKAKAIENGDEDTAERIALLGRLFRWACHTDDKFVILEEELEYVKTYLQLQSMRYDDEIEICIQTEEEYLDYAVPKLILQPVVENVIKHAFRNLGHSGLTGISVRKKGTNLEITVYDNGRGIKKEELDKIQHNLRTDAGQHEFGSIGIQNVNHRLKLLFGAGYGLQIASISEKGTAVKVILPALYKEEMTEYVQAADNGR